jgi:hypothetical protein
MNLIGDAIVIVADNSPRISWSLGRVRRVMLKIRGTVLECHVDILCIILEADIYQ